MAFDSNAAAELVEKRGQLKRAGTLSLSDPKDALAAYYALYHEPRRTQLWLHRRGSEVEGLVAVCQTGQRLFQPTVVLRAPDMVMGVELLRQALVPGRPYYLITIPQLAPSIETVVDLQRPEHNRVYVLDVTRFKPIINVLVRPDHAPDGSRRFVVRSGSQMEVVAVSGINWRSPHFAEVFVYTEAAARGRGWGKSVLSACTGYLMREGVRPLYIVEEDNQPSIWLAESLGYVDDGAREFAGEGVCRPEY